MKYDFKHWFEMEIYCGWKDQPIDDFLMLGEIGSIWMS